MNAPSKKIEMKLHDRHTGSTISTLLHGKSNPKHWQVLSHGDAGFLQFFWVVSSHYGKPGWMVLAFWTFHQGQRAPPANLHPSPGHHDDRSIGSGYLNLGGEISRRFGGWTCWWESRVKKVVDFPGGSRHVDCYNNRTPQLWMMKNKFPTIKE